MIINTRPRPYETAMQNALNGIGCDVLDCPVLSVRAVPYETLLDPDALIFTSQLAVGFVSQDYVTQDLPVFAVGDATAQAATAKGFSQVIDGGGTAKTLLRTLDSATFQSGLYLSARHVSCDVAVVRPARIKRQVVYETIPTISMRPAVVDAITASEHLVVPFYSPRSFQAFEALAGKYGLANHLSKATAVVIHSRVLAQRNLRWGQTRIADTPSRSGMIDAISKAA